MCFKTGKLVGSLISLVFFVLLSMSSCIMTFQIVFLVHRNFFSANKTCGIAPVINKEILHCSFSWNCLCSSLTFLFSAGFEREIFGALYYVIPVETGRAEAGKSRPHVRDRGCFMSPKQKTNRRDFIRRVYFSHQITPGLKLNSK